MIGFIVTSCKVGTRGQPNSAVEELLYRLQSDIKQTGLETEVLSFRDHDVPQPNSKTLSERDGLFCRKLHKLLRESDLLVLGLTAYLGHISASSKTLFELYAGADYDLPYPENQPSIGPPALPLVVGTDSLTTSNGCMEAMDLCARVGWQAQEVISVNNPRHNPMDYSAISFSTFSRIAEIVSLME